jgi:hypothetical protein
LAGQVLGKNFFILFSPGGYKAKKKPAERRAGCYFFLRLL